MKFGIAKHPKLFYKNTEKSLNAKRNNSQEISSFEDGKVHINFC